MMQLYVRPDNSCIMSPQLKNGLSYQQATAYQDVSLHNAIDLADSLKNYNLFPLDHFIKSRLIFHPKCQGICQQFSN